MIIHCNHQHTFTRNNAKLFINFEVSTNYRATDRHNRMRLLHNNRIKNSCTKTEILRTKSRLLVEGIVIGWLLWTKSIKKWIWLIPLPQVSCMKNVCKTNSATGFVCKGSRRWTFNEWVSIFKIYWFLFDQNFNSLNCTEKSEKKRSSITFIRCSI